MDPSAPVLHLMCGMPAAGKSTLAARLGADRHTIVLSEDAWLSALFGDQMTTLADYGRCSARLRSAMAPHVEALLHAGLCVVLDFPANTPEQRLWMRDVIHRTGVRHQMHVFDLPDAVCLSRLHRRNAARGHPFAATDAEFAQIARHFSPPDPSEGFEIVYVAQTG